MSLRSLPERAIQTVTFELGGILFAAPLYALVFSAPLDHSVAVIAALALAMMLWSPLHNTVFDTIELRLTGRVASDRPHAVRVLHAISHEATSMVITLPLLIGLGAHPLPEAFLIDIGLTAFSVVYAYIFNVLYDRLRPVRPRRLED